MIWDKQRPVKAAVERCQGRANRASTSPPQELGTLFSYTHRPWCSRAHGPAGSGVDFPIPQNSFVWVSLKMDSRARGTKKARHEACEAAGGRRRAACSRESDQYASTAFSPAPAAALPAPFSYTHRPWCSRARGPAGSGVDLPIPQNSSVWVPLKVDSRAPAPGEPAGAPPGPGRRPGGRGWAAGWPQPTYPIPPSSPTLYLPPTHRTSPPPPPPPPPPPLPHPPPPPPPHHTAPPRAPPGPRRRPAARRPAAPRPQPTYPLPPASPTLYLPPPHTTSPPDSPTLPLPQLAYLPLPHTPQPTYPAPAPTRLPYTPQPT